MRDAVSHTTNNDEHLVRVTAALYRVTDLWDDDEPLREDMREAANVILETIMSGGYDEAEARVMMGYLSVAEAAGCANPMNFLVLKREYRMVFGHAADDARHKSAERKMAMTSKVFKALKTPEMQNRMPDRRGENKEEVPVPVPYPAFEQKTDTVDAPSGVMNERQRAIMERLRQSGMVKISDFFETFAGVSSKTIQRDLQDLTARHLIRKTGEKRWTTYMLSETDGVRYMSHEI